MEKKAMNLPMRLVGTFLLGVSLITAFPSEPVIAGKKATHWINLLESSSQKDRLKAVSHLAEDVRALPYILKALRQAHTKVAGIKAEITDQKDSQNSKISELLLLIQHYGNQNFPESQNAIDDLAELLERPLKFELIYIRPLAAITPPDPALNGWFDSFLKHHLDGSPSTDPALWKGLTPLTAKSAHALWLVYGRNPGAKLSVLAALASLREPSESGWENYNQLYEQTPVKDQWSLLDGFPAFGNKSIPLLRKHFAQDQRSAMRAINIARRFQVLTPDLKAFLKEASEHADAPVKFNATETLRFLENREQLREIKK